ncbi:probable disease resistance protein At1g61300 isoform X2 [Syzygium oleosum]|nr:probable disease resistance protein At1g61300 isoform X2 [Syzygium oleosum]
MNRGSPIMNVRSIYANDEEIRNLKRKVKELDYKEAAINEQMEIESAASSVRKKPRILVEKWLKETERARNNSQIIGQTNAETLPPKEQVETLTREVEELTEQTLPQTLLIEARDAKGDAFLERKLIGEASHRNIELIWDRLKENHVCKLGIYGMGGVGKTAIMMHIHNRLLKDATFDGVLFITVSQDFSIYKLQSDIWKALKLGIMEDEHEKKRAAMLSKHLERKKNCVLILDDVWRHFKLQDVGIPDRAGLKVVLTTRLSEVCSRMDCEEIKIQPLGEEEAWKLFVEELGPKPLTNILLTDKRVEKVARKIANRCAGLPLAINTMASSFRGEKNFCVWQDTLNKLDKSHTKHTEMGDRVLPVLTLSYERLSDPQVKQCFLFCALFPEGESIDQMELIEYFIDEGFLDELDTRDAQYCRGLAIVDMLRKACLVEVDCDGDIRMHDLIREMALHIRGTAYMVKAGWGLRRIPNGEYWTEDLEKVSLMGGCIKDIPPDMSPDCPKLSTLLLNESLQLENVQRKDSFFMKLQGLKVLNLSQCAIRELPDSLSELVNLRALLLRNCRSLLCIPHLRKLKFFRKLDARGCWSLVEVQGLEELRNLRYLDLSETGIDRLLEGTLRRMVNLQYLTIAGTVEAEEVIQLKALERLECKFGNVDDFNKYVRFIERSDPHRDSLSLFVDQEESLWFVTTHVYSDPRKSLWIQESHYKSYQNVVQMRSCNCAMARVGKESNNDSILIPGDVEVFMGSNCHGMANLSGMGLLRCLKVLLIFKWDNLIVLFGGDGVDEEVVCNTRDFPAFLFPSLEMLQIEGCSKLKYLFGHESGFSLSLGGPAFPRLENIRVTNCGSMKRLAGSEWFPHFPNLRTIKVENCNSIRELLWHESLLHLPNLEHIMVIGCEGIEGIISRRGENHGRSSPLNTPSSSLPSPLSPYFRNLRTIEVGNCNNIRELLPHECFLHLPNLEYIKVSDCEKIDEIIGRGRENHRGSAPLSTPSSSLLSPLSPRFPNLRTIEVKNCNNIRELLPHNCLLHLPNLEYIKVNGCEGLEEIISGGGETHGEGAPLNSLSSSSPSPFCPHFPNLRTIEVENCNNIMELLPHEYLLHLPNLEHIKVRDCEGTDEMISGGGENHGASAPLNTTSSSLPSPFFPNMRKIEVKNCNNIRELLSPECLPHFPNLEWIMVHDCEGIEGIISGGGENSPFSSLKLKTLVLYQLPQLKSIMWDALSFIPDAFVVVQDCPKLKTIPPCVERLDVFRRCKAHENDGLPP